MDEGLKKIFSQLPAHNIRFHHNEYYWSRAKHAGNADNAGALRKAFSLAALVDQAEPRTCLGGFLTIDCPIELPCPVNQSLAALLWVP
jgi:hypothetical protein